MTDDGINKPNDDTTTPDLNPPAVKRSKMRWLLPIVALLVMVAIVCVLFGKMRDDTWAYYTDDEGLKVSVDENRERFVLWEDPKRHLFQEQETDPTDPEAVDTINHATRRVEAAFSPDGTMMVLTRWSLSHGTSEPNADLYYSTWDGRIWSRPVPMDDLNSEYNERGAAFSRDGRYLYFASDRVGGLGGYDLYVALAGDETWAGVEHLGDTVNSSENETGPAPSTDGDHLYFSSDCDADSEASDIYVARGIAPDVALPEGESPDLPALPPVPRFAQAEPVSALNSNADDLEAALTRRGDYLFLASDRDRDDKSGFNLYQSRVIDGQGRRPEKVEVYIQRGNATDPAVRMEGFDLLFSADGDLAVTEPKGETPDATTEAEQEPGYLLYRSTTREVIGYTDLSRWDLFGTLMSRIYWWVLLAIASLIALIYLLEKWRDITNLYHKCLAASVMAHLALLFVMMFWLISQALSEGGDRQSPDVALSVDALAQEELAMESEQELAQMAESTQLIVTKTVQDFREVAFVPTDTISVPVVRRSADQSLVSNFKPSMAHESELSEAVSQPIADAPSLTDLGSIELPAIKVEQLEVAHLENIKAVEPVDMNKDDFRRNEEAIQQILTTKVAVSEAEATEVEVESSAEMVEASSQPEVATHAISPVDSLEAKEAMKNLEGEMSEESLTSNLPGTSVADGLSKGMELEVPAVDPGQGNFQGDEGAIGQVRSGKSDPGGATNRDVNMFSDGASIANGGGAATTIDTGGDAIHPSDGLEADGVPPKLDGIDAPIPLAAKLPGNGTLDSFLHNDKLETPQHNYDPKSLSKYLRRQTGKPSLIVIEQLGGSTGTERAIGLGLEWFTSHQERDGHWDMGKHGSKSQYNVAGTGLALLCYYGWGIKHGIYGKDSEHPRHHQAATKALEWLLKQQKEDGDLRGPSGQHAMYAHGIASIAICEAYGLTKDPRLKEPAMKAIDFILKAQHAAGGWRYNPGMAGDLSVTGWQYMALHSARMAGLEVPDEAFEKTQGFLHSISAGRNRGLYGYASPETGKITMTATGMFMRQLDLEPPTQPRMQEGADAIKAYMIKSKNADFYLDYYATLALYQHQGPIWEEWNERIKESYLALQHISGPQKGSWDPKGQHVTQGGRVLATGLAILSLEVYYRRLPLYGFQRE
jgi:hypothetical protein